MVAMGERCCGSVSNSSCSPVVGRLKGGAEAMKIGAPHDPETALGPLISEEHRDKVFHVRRPHSVNTVLVDGQVAGTWTVEKGRGVVVEPFDTIPARFRVELEDERAALEAFVS